MAVRHDVLLPSFRHQPWPGKPEDQGAGMTPGKIQRVTAATAAATVSRFARLSAATQMRPLSSA